MSGTKAASPAWAGWILFASTMLMVVGVFNVIEGVVALFEGHRIAISEDHLVLIDLTGFGWLLIISGGLLTLIGAALLSGKGWARVTGIVVIGLHAVLQVFWLGAYPVWSLLMLGLDVTVLWALTARWSAAKEELGYGTGDVLPR
jgi:hypothetical protein